MTTRAEQGVPLDRNAIDSILEKRNVDPAKATIREMTTAVAEIESQLGCRYLRMEFGIPGLDPDPLAGRAEAEAHKDPRVIATYPPIAGLPRLKEAASVFGKQFLNLEIPAEFVIPTVGSMQGGFLSQAVAGRRDPKKDRILFIDPCFSVHRTQCRFLGLKEASVDLYDRDVWLDRVEDVCRKGDVGAVLYSSPNNPTWVILKDAELERLGRICDKYDVIAVEDSAYLGMDFREDYSVPGKPPYPPTIANHTGNYILLISGSKIFSFAGQRVGMAFLSPSLSKKEFPGLARHFGYTKFWDAFVMSGIYCVTSGVSSTPQIGLAAFLEAASSGELRFLETAREYGRRAHFMRDVMMKNGFHLVYDHDLGEPLADGFFFTFAYPGMTGARLVRELLYYGISATTLEIARSSRSEAVRACVSLIGEKDFPLFQQRIETFRRDHPARG
ncbi:MAG: pyridoxal phosphate-dependent aminotransferase [Pseudomonadota bacterium]